MGTFDQEFMVLDNASDKLNPSFYDTLSMHIVTNMYPKNHLPDPCGGETVVDLSVIYIPAASKEWFARDILAKNIGVHWDNVYNLHKNITAGWSMIFKSVGHILEPGRPALFSEKEKKN